jgi:hypothetical protein
MQSKPKVASDDWSLYAHHRAHLTAALVGSARSAGGTLCLLGAGACNDVDLETLAQTFARIHLVDIDPSAVGRAIARQSPTTRARLVRHAPLDLATFSKRRLMKWKRMPPRREEIEQAASASLEALFAELPGPFDLVASVCVLTQMSFALNEALGQGHPVLPAARVALMSAHLHTLVGLAAPRGSALFACDMVSSNLYPLDALATGADLRAVMDDVVAAGASYFTANPGMIQNILGQDPFLLDRVAEAELLDPWLWTGPLARSYLVYALRLRT